MTGEIKSFKDLIAWQKAIALCRQVYNVSGCFPDAERFGLTAQVRRAVVSIPSNIAEGYGRRRTQDYIRHLDIARGSLSEVETQLILAHELGFAGPDDLEPCIALVREVDRVLYALTEAIRDSDASPGKTR